MIQTAADVPDYMTAAEAAAMLGVGKMTVIRLVASGQLTPLRRDPYIFHCEDVRAVAQARHEKRTDA